MDHSCDYRAQPRKVGTQYAGDTKTIVTQTTLVWVQACEICGKPKPKTPTDEFITIRSNYSYDLKMGYKLVEEGDVGTERLPTCDWMDFIPMDRNEEPLYIRINKIKETNCHCKYCYILKRYVDFIDDNQLYLYFSVVLFFVIYVCELNSHLLYVSLHIFMCI